MKKEQKIEEMNLELTLKNEESLKESKELISEEELMNPEIPVIEFN